MTCICTQCRGDIAGPFARPERTAMQRVLLISVGWLMMALAVIGWVLPIMPGYIFFVLGLLILSSEYVWAHKLVQRVRTRFPKMSGKMDGITHSLTLRFNHYF